MWNNHWEQLWPSRMAPSPLPTPVHPLGPRSQRSGHATPPWKGLWGLLVSLQRGAALEGHQWILPSLLTPCRIRKEGQGTQEHTWGLSPKTLNWDRQWQEAVRGQGPSQSKRKECFQHKAWPDGPRVPDTREGAPGALRMLWALEQRKGLAFLPSGGDNG